MIEFIDTMKETLAHVMEDIKNLRDRAKSLQYERDELKKMYDGCVLDLKEANTIKEKYRIMSAQYQRLHAVEQDANEILRSKLTLDLTRCKTSALIAELARRMDLIEGEL